MNSTAELIKVTSVPAAFREWLEIELSDGKYIEVIISKRYVMSVHVKEPDDGDWSKMEYGNITSSNDLWFKQNVYHPAMVNSKFVFNYNGRRKEV